MAARYWLATWTWDAWLVFQDLKPTTIGLPRRPDISVGDIFLNYVRQEGSVPGQWVSAERIVGPYLHDDTQIYLDGIWPHRWPVEPASPRYLAGDGIVAKDLVGGMDMFRGMTGANWGSPLRTAGREISQHDGELVLGLLRSGTPADPLLTGVARLPARASSSVSGKTRRREVPPSMRYRVLHRDGFRCVKCGRCPATEPEVRLHVDHVLPWSRGGSSTEDNLQTLCAECNLGKSNRFDD